jgi:hypothetical protein
MNYQFKRDQHGSPVAEFDMGSEAFTHWFTQELGNDQEKIAAIFVAIEQLESKQIKEFVIKGKEFGLLLDPYEVEIRSTILSLEAPEELPEGTELYDQESMSGCGLEDFLHVLRSWSDFVKGK